MARNALMVSIITVLLACLGLVACYSGGGSAQKETPPCGATKSIIFNYNGVAWQCVHDCPDGYSKLFTPDPSFSTGGYYQCLQNCPDGRPPYWNEIDEEWICGATPTATPTSGPTTTPTSSPTSTPTPSPTPSFNDCYNQLANSTWTFVTARATGTLTFDQNKKVVAITQSTCAGMTVDAQESSTSGNASSGIVTIQYISICNGKRYNYEVQAKFTGSGCNMMSGTKEGNYSGGITESIALQKQ